MSKKTSLSIQSKQSHLIRNSNQTINHSLSKRKQFLTIVTPSHRQYKPIKTLKQIKKIALGGRNNSNINLKKQVIVKKQIIPQNQIPSFISQNNSWRRDLTININQYQSPQICQIECSARTMETKIQSSNAMVPETPINRLLLSTISNYDI